MRFKVTALNAAVMGGSVIVNMIIPNSYKDALNGLTSGFKAGNEYELKQYKQKRSLSANALCWVYCDELAKVLKTTKEEVYRYAIGFVGVFEEVRVNTPEAAERFKKIWYSHGVGWLTKSVDETTILAYYGSSTYNTAEMARLIDFLQDECKRQGIEVRPQEEVEALIREWERGKKGKA